MNIEHFKKRLIHLHQKPLTETTQTKTKQAKDDPDDDASSNSSASSGSTSRKQEWKKESGVQQKVARKRAVCRTKFRHENMKIFKLGNSIPTSLCKSKEPYNVSTEKNLQLCCENKQTPQLNNNNNDKKHGGTNGKESITEQIIHSIHGNNKKDNVSKNYESSPINNTSKLTGRHSLPAIIPEIPVKKQRNFSSKSSGDEQKKAGRILYRRKTVAANEFITNEERDVTIQERPNSNGGCQQKQVIYQNVFNGKDRISPDSTVQTLESKNKTFTPVTLNISLPFNTSITPIMSRGEQILVPKPIEVPLTGQLPYIYSNEKTTNTVQQQFITRQPTSLNNEMYSNKEKTKKGKPPINNLVHINSRPPEPPKIYNVPTNTTDSQRYTHPIVPNRNPNNSQIIPNRHLVPPEYTQPTVPLNMSVKNMNYPAYLEQHKQKNIAPANSISNNIPSSEPLKVHNPEVTTSINNNIYIQQHICNSSNRNASQQMPPEGALQQKPTEIDATKSMVQMVYSVMSGTFSVDNLLKLSYFYKQLMFVSLNPTTPKDVRFYSEDIVNEIVSYVTVKLFEENKANPVLRQFTKQILEFHLQHNIALLKDVFHLIKVKCTDQDWMRSFFMLLSRSAAKSSSTTRFSSNNIPTGKRLPSQREAPLPYQSSEWFRNPVQPIPNMYIPQEKKAKTSVQRKKTYRPRVNQVEKTYNQQVLPPYVPESLVTRSSYPADSRYIPPKTDSTPCYKIVPPLDIGSSIPNYPIIYSVDDNKIEKQPVKQVETVNNTIANVIVKDKSMEITKTDQTTDTSVGENVDIIKNIIKKEISNDNSTELKALNSGDDLNLFKEILRREDKNIYNKVLKRLVNVKEIVTASEVIVIDDDQDSVKNKTSNELAIKVKRDSPSTPPRRIYIIENDTIKKEPRHKDKTSDYNQNYITSPDIKKSNDKINQANLNESYDGIKTLENLSMKRKQDVHFTDASLKTITDMYSEPSSERKHTYLPIFRNVDKTKMENPSPKITKNKEVPGDKTRKLKTPIHIDSSCTKPSNGNNLLIHIPPTPAIENISSDEDEVPRSKSVGYFSNSNVYKEDYPYTVSVPVTRTDHKKFTRDNNSTLSHNPYYSLEDSVSKSPKNCNTPKRVSPMVVQSPVGLISPTSTGSGLELMAKTGNNWKNWITEERRKEFLETRRSSDRRQSVETISSIGSDYSPSIDHDDTHVQIRVDNKWYRVKKSVMESIPKGKMSYDRERNYLVRYFDDNQLEQFIKNVNINVVLTSEFFKPDRKGGYLSENIFLTPFEVPEKNEVIQLASDISFTKDDNISEPELYVQEVEKVERFVPKDFLGFYKYVTGYQIIHNHDPISFQTFLTMHNTNRIKSFFKKYVMSVLENKYV